MGQTLELLNKLRIQHDCVLHAMFSNANTGACACAIECREPTRRLPNHGGMPDMIDMIDSFITRAPEE